MKQQTPAERTEEQPERPVMRERHPLTLENSTEETIRRMRALPERAERLREALRAHREANPR